MSLNGQYVRNITFLDGTDVRNGTIFTMTWEVKNTGNTAWEPNTISVVAIQDPERLVTKKTTVQRNLGRVPIKGLAKISVKLKAPATKGRHICKFRLAYFRPDLFRFGRLFLPSYVADSCFGKKFYVSFCTLGDTDDKDIVKLGKILLKSEYWGMTQDFNAYYDNERTGLHSIVGYHPGVDFRARTPLPVYSPVDGKVVATDKEYGMVGIQVQNTDYCFFLAHLSKYSKHIKKEGNVTVGMQIGMTGAIGTKAAHLHVELRSKRLHMSKYFTDAYPNIVNIHPKKLLTDAVFKQAIGAMPGDEAFIFGGGVYYHPGV
ncbi:MAG: peptidoglycan DD-metalloendopeptidase family protein [Deltaproteobacteria bacterium]|nr:peptidoglycan DD-metalloendopeptidase family protein [Deltaproteobacteria bacterium]